MSGLDLTRLSGFPVFILNYSLRILQDFPFTCTYYGSFDSNVVATLYPLIQSYVLSSDSPIQKYFVADSSLSFKDPFGSIVTCPCSALPPNPPFEGSPSLPFSAPFLHSGVNAAFNASLMGFTTIFLAGIDCSYSLSKSVDNADDLKSLSSSEASHSSLLNYWRPDYHRAGDAISSPLPSKLQFDEWYLLSKFLKSSPFCQVNIFNICDASPFDLFPRLTI